MGAKPVHLRGGVAVHDIALVILEVPRNDDKDISLTNPNPFFDFSLDTTESGDTVRATNTDVVGTKHQFSLGKLFFVAFVRQFHTYNAAIFGNILIVIFNRTQVISPCSRSIGSVQR